MAVGQRDPVTVLYRTLMVFAALGILILAAGLAEFLYFEPPGAASAGASARIVGVFHYDPATNKTSGPDEQSFSRSDQFAAVVDWSTLPDTMVVQAAWFDSFQNMVGGVGADKPSALRAHSTIPVAVPANLKLHLPGEYLFAVERVVNGLPVAVLARRIIEVPRE